MFWQQVFLFLPVADLCVLDFQMPSLEELKAAGKEERLNVFRRYFASSRYNRLLIQQTLVRSALDSSLAKQVNEMERLHNQDFFNTVKKMKKYGYLEEFLLAVREEDDALQRIIEAYNQRMKSAG
jgi:hypothetical protein